MRSQPNPENGTTRRLTALLANRYWRAAEAKQVVTAWERSGQSGAAFAREHGVSVRRLRRWRERLKPSPAPVFHPVRVVERAGPIAGTTALELELRGGRRIRVPAGFDAALLEELVRTIEGWGC